MLKHILFISLTFFTSKLLAVQANDLIYGQDRRIVLLATEDPLAYYTIPQEWSLYKNQAYIVKETNDSYLLRFILAPNYAKSIPQIRNIRRNNPASFFLPIPIQELNSDVVISDSIGTVNLNLTPSSKSPNIDLFYYNLRLNRNQYEIVKAISGEAEIITGSVRYLIDFNGDTIPISVPLFLQLPSNMFLDDTPPTGFDSSWYRAFFERTTFHETGKLDGSFEVDALFFKIDVEIEDSEYTVKIDEKSTRFNENGDNIEFSAKSDANLFGSLSFRIAPFGLDLKVDFEANLEGVFSQTLKEVSDVSVDFTSIEIDDTGSLSSGVVNALEGYLNGSDWRVEIEEEVNEKLADFLNSGFISFEDL
ncbi:hypothetical protein [Pseudobacteriovorax antillogorgiicola]|uniref:Uncharacterized protein n=1 Tax=Pseudobacteriovorax antillogorgiicola TaxID=1513793 RepID=A0A1Y6CB44_9BACT|nr:hypothetical protein [Pseudobacteriovorax antillogorgiicola]TCS48656.1 hypothetical protein EDD56_11778 [Pseudobacteriovorax antillogorgiicola]SMF55135.1 hypothetical protein SAMN06296036_11781 [Pseudobacteriovorax antillogorgiicola]